MNKELKDENIQFLLRAIASIDSVELCAAFLEDICTINELKSISQRLEVARLLRKHTVYSEIVEKTGASTTTISRVNRCINYGTGGYNAVLDAMEAMDSAEVK